MTPLNPRLIYAAMFLVCAGLMAFGLYLQHAKGLEPCPLCILQRYAFIVTGAIALVAALHGPGRVGRWIYGLLLVAASATGAAIAGRQTWLQHNPPQVLDCGPDLAYMVDSFPIGQWLPKVFQGEGDCAKVGWKFAGLSIPEWALAWFAAFILAALFAALLRQNKRRAQ